MNNYSSKNLSMNKSPPPWFAAPCPPTPRGNSFHKRGELSTNVSNTYVEPNFKRNRFRATMPKNTKHFESRSGRSKFYSNYCPSPSSSYASNGTTYAQPWNSTVFESPDKEVSFKKAPMRRSISMSDKNQEENSSTSDEKTKTRRQNDRPIINFSQFKKIFKKPKKVYCDSSEIPTTAPGKKLANSKTTSISSVKEPISKMQQEDKMKMFRKVGMQQVTKMSNVQRMQRERQRDFALFAPISVPSTMPGTSKDQSKVNKDNNVGDGKLSIDSMLVFESPPKKPRDCISLNDNDVEVLISNKLTGKPAKSAEIASTRVQNVKGTKKGNAPQMTSTPKCYGSKPQQNSALDVSNVNFVSNSSLCLIGDENPTNISQKQESTMYYSTIGIETSTNSLNSAQSDAHENSVLEKRANSVKTEINDISYERAESQSSGQCPSFGCSIPAEETITEPCSSIQPSIPSDLDLPDQDQLTTLWKISQALKERNDHLSRVIPDYEISRTRIANLGVEKSDLLLRARNIEAMEKLWELCGEEDLLRKNLSALETDITESQNAIRFLEMRRDTVLCGQRKDSYV